MNAELLQKENELLLDKIKKIEIENKKLSAEKNEMRLLIEQLKEDIRIWKLLHFGKKSEKKSKEDEKQGKLFNEAEDKSFEQQDAEQIKAATETTKVNSHTRRVSKNAGRKPISSSLPRREVEYDIPEKDKKCACGRDKVCIGEDISERVEIIPAKIGVIRERRKKYACRYCEGTFADEAGVTTAEGIKHLVSGSIADESLIAWSISEKFEFALPFYRQAKRLSQIGIDIPRATLCNLAIKAAEACKPLYELLKKNILSGNIINADETRVQVLREPGRKAEDLSWMWVFLGGAFKKSVIFQYETGRSHTVPYDFLKEYSGWLQTDDYEAYHTAIKKIGTNIKHVLCWAHVRRRFHQYWEISKSKEAENILELIGELFRLEDLQKSYPLDEFLRERKNRALPILEKLKKILIELYLKLPPSLNFGKAISYTLDNWDQLVLYLENGMITPSNNAAENSIRPFVIGRKNWLFSVSPQGAQSSAILYSLSETAKMNNLTPFEYFYFILKKLPYCSIEKDYENLLPYNLTAEIVKIEQGKN